MTTFAFKIGSIAALISLYTAPARAGGECHAAVPSDMQKTPTHWLGACPNSYAEGPGVMRGGTSEPFDFFAGEMRKGSPVRGIVILREGWIVVTRFDAAHRDATPRSTEQDENHAVFVLAIRAAQATAQRFAAAGNQGSAAYYQRLAKRLRDGEPE